MMSLLAELSRSEQVNVLICLMLIGVVVYGYIFWGGQGSKKPIRRYPYNSWNQEGE